MPEKRLKRVTTSKLYHGKRLRVRNTWLDYPRRKPAKGTPLIETGNREGWEEIRDGAYALGGKVAAGLGWIGKKLKPHRKGKDAADAAKPESA